MGEGVCGNGGGGKCGLDLNLLDGELWFGGTWNMEVGLGTADGIRSTRPIRMLIGDGEESCGDFRIVGGTDTEIDS